MGYQISRAALAAALGTLCATAAFAQAPGPAPGMRGPGGPGAPTAGGVAVANPTYTTLLFEKEIDRPAAEVFKRVGKYCDIGEWMRVPCTITSGTDGELGAVRSLGREILVARTELSYSYTQPVVDGRPYNLYHGTLEVRPLTPTTSKIVYSLMWDNSMLPDDAAREREKNRYVSMFEDALNNMKILSEGGTLPPPPARGPGGFGAPRGGAGGAPGAGPGPVPGGQR